MTTPPDSEPGYCIICGDFHLITPVPGRRGGVCAAPSCRERLQPYEPGPRHVCNTSDRRKPGHPEYRQCSCGQWYHSGGGYWYRVPHPPARWLREHGMNPEEFWDMDDQDQGTRLFDDFPVRRPTLLMFLRWLFRR